MCTSLINRFKSSTYIRAHLISTHLLEVWSYTWISPRFSDRVYRFWMPIYMELWFQLSHYGNLAI